MIGRSTITVVRIPGQTNVRQSLRPQDYVLELEADSYT